MTKSESNRYGLKRCPSAWLAVGRTLPFALASAVAGCGSHVIHFNPNSDGGQTGSTGGEVTGGFTDAGATGGQTGGTTASNSVTGGASGSSGSGVTGGASNTTGTGTGSSGSSANGGTTGAVPQQADKIDLLFMIDNSPSMGDKQELLAQAVPDLLDRFLVPNCVDNSGALTAPPGTSPCPTGSGPEFTPIGDIHIGVISSSLGSHGAEVAAAAVGAQAKCSPDDPQTPYPNDMAHLLTRASGDGTAVTNLNLNPPFLNWNTNGGAGAITNSNDLINQHYCRKV